MPDWVVGFFSTIVGAAVAVAAIVIQQRAARDAEAAAREAEAEERNAARKAEVAAQRRRLATRYLAQMQDAADSLWFRLENLHDREGAAWMDLHDAQYREITTCYALGRYLATDRILTLEGVWPELMELDKELAEFLRNHRLDEDDSGLFYYDQIALAEMVLERDDSGFRISTYLDFRSHYASPDFVSPAWRDKVWKSLDGLSSDQMTSSMKMVAEVATRLESITGVKSAVGARQRNAVGGARS